MNDRVNINPKVSVILPVYNAAKYIKTSIQSILEQSFTDFEFIIINDGSMDNSEEIILSYQDPRIIYIYQENKGLGATLNVGINMSRGKYIARQDQDDISLPDRFKKQVRFMEENPQILLLGTRAEIIREDTSEITYHNHPCNSSVLKFDLLFDNPFVHSSVMFRKSTIEKIGRYNPDRNLYEDYDLWSRISYIGKVANLEDVLVKYLHHEAGLSKNFSNFKEFAVYNQGIKNMEHLIGRTDKELSDLLALYHFHKTIYKGSSFGDMKKSFNIIISKLVEEFPDEKLLIHDRKKYYLRFIIHRLSAIKKSNTKPNLFEKVLYKIQNAIFEWNL